MNQLFLRNINLIVLSTCHSGGFQELFTQICKPKNIVYVNKKDPIADIVCVSFVEYFYSELIEGNQINESFEKTIKKLKTNSKILSIVPNPLTIDDFKPSDISLSYVRR